MTLLRRLRARWTARRFELAKAQLAARGLEPGDPVERTDAFTGMHVQSQRALGGMLSPKAKTTTEWRGD